MQFLLRWYELICIFGDTAVVPFADILMVNKTVVSLPWRETEQLAVSSPAHWAVWFLSESISICRLKWKTKKGKQLIRRI